MIDITTTVTEDGKISDYAREQLRIQFKHAWAGKTVRIRLSGPKRSSRANSYYWGCVIKTIHQAMLLTGAAQQIDLDTGVVTTLSPQDIHDDLKQTYIPPRSVEIFGETKTLPPSSAALSVAEFSDYVEAIMTDERVLRLLAVAGLDFPSPSDYQEANGNFRSGKISEVT